MCRGRAASNAGCVSADCLAARARTASGCGGCDRGRRWQREGSDGEEQQDRMDGLMPFGVNKITGRPGPAPKQAADGNRKQARQRINVEVRTGRRPSPGDLPCADCGHRGPDRKHEYDHYRGYGAENHLDVQAVCVPCHGQRESNRITHCKRGHKFTPENTGRKSSGARFCRKCRRAFDRRRRDADYWCGYRANRKNSDG